MKDLFFNVSQRNGQLIMRQKAGQFENVTFGLPILAEFLVNIA
jgi:hypothetical protein